MSIVPLMYRDWWDDFDRPTSRLNDQFFGSGLRRDDLISDFLNFGFPKMRSHFDRPAYYRPWRSLQSQTSGGSSTICAGKDSFQVILDVQQFAPEEILVKTIDNSLIVEAKHSEKQDEHGFVSRHFVRRYVLPSTHDATNVTSTLSSDGVLTVTAPKKNIEPAGIERVVEVKKTGLPATPTAEVTKPFKETEIPIEKH